MLQPRALLGLLLVCSLSEISSPKRQSLLFDKHPAVHHPFMDDVALVIDEREALRAHFIGSDDITAALARAQQGQTDDGTEQSEKDAIVAFDAMQAGFQLRDGGCVHERRYWKRVINKLFLQAFVLAGRHGSAWKFQAATTYCESSVSFMR